MRKLNVKKRISKINYGPHSVSLSLPISGQITNFEAKF